MRPSNVIAAIVLDVVSAAHLLRLVFHTEVIVGGTVMPMWISIFGCVIPAVLSIMLLRDGRDARRA